MTDRPTQLVGSLHGSLYLMLIAWLALLDRVTSVTLPYYFINSNQSFPAHIMGQAVMKNSGGQYQQLVVNNFVVYIVKMNKLNDSTIGEHIGFDPIPKKELCIDDGTGGCSLGAMAASNEHGVVLIGSADYGGTGTPPKILEYTISDGSFNQVSATGFGNINFIEWIPGTELFVIPSSNDSGFALWLWKPAGLSYLEQEFQNGFKYTSALCFRENSCLLEFRDLSTKTSTFTFIDPVATDPGFQHALTITWTGIDPVSVKRLTALNLFAVANGSQWITFYSMNAPFDVKAVVTAGGEPVKAIETACDIELECVLYAVTEKYLFTFDGKFMSTQDGKDVQPLLATYWIPPATARVISLQATPDGKALGMVNYKSSVVNYLLAFDCFYTCQTCSGRGPYGCKDCQSGLVPDASGICLLPTVCHDRCLTCFGPTENDCFDCKPGHWHLDRSGILGDYYCKDCDGSCATCVGPSADQCTSCVDLDLRVTSIAGSACIACDYKGSYFSDGTNCDQCDSTICKLC